MRTASRLNSSLCIAAIFGLLDGEYRSQKTGTKPVQVQNALGLTTQVPVKSVYLTSGRSRVLNLGRQAVELRHAPRWQLVLGNKTSGQAVRALAWLGPDEAPKALQILRSKLTEAAKTELVSAAPQFPTWLARLIGKMVHPRASIAAGG
jgi:hypothetical protein